MDLSKAPETSPEKQILLSSVGVNTDIGEPMSGIHTSYSGKGMVLGSVQLDHLQAAKVSGLDYLNA